MMDKEKTIDYFDYLIIKDFLISFEYYECSSITRWNQKDLSDFLTRWCKEDAHDLPVKRLMEPLRQALTGRKKGLSVSAIMALLGFEECFKRIKTFIEMCENNLPNNMRKIHDAEQ
jgi:glutamyl/glutaminyl-tRNA synthetase